MLRFSAGLKLLGVTHPARREWVRFSQFPQGKQKSKNDSLEPNCIFEYRKHLVLLFYLVLFVCLTFKTNSDL